MNRFTHADADSANYSTREARRARDLCFLACIKDADLEQLIAIRAQLVLHEPNARWKLVAVDRRIRIVQLHL